MIIAGGNNSTRNEPCSISVYQSLIFKIELVCCFITILVKIVSFSLKFLVPCSHFAKVLYFLQSRGFPWDVFRTIAHKCIANFIASLLNFNLMAFFINNSSPVSVILISSLLWRFSIVMVQCIVSLQKLKFIVKDWKCLISLLSKGNCW